MNTPFHDNKFGVFLALTFRDKLFEKYDGVSKDIQNTDFTSLIMTARHDGYFGFIGGRAEIGENERQCLARECYEESNIDINKLDLVRVCEHTLEDGFRIILYHSEITKQKAQSIIGESVFAKHFFTETVGLCSIALHNKTHFYKNAFLSAAKKEFVQLGELIKSDTLISWGNI